MPRKPFEQLFLLTFGTNPLLCPECKQRMELELLWHPKYGVLRNFFESELEEIDLGKTKEQPLARTDGGRSSMGDPKRMVSLPLPFL